MFSIDPKKVGSINDGGRKLKLGKHAYLITGASMAVVKSNPTGKEQQVVFDLQAVKDKGYNCKEYLSVMSPNDTVREIAAKTLVGFAEAAGIGGILKPERLKSFINKIVVIEARETPGKGENKGKTYVNLATVEAYDDEEAEEEEDEVEEEEETEEESEEEETEETEEEESEEEDPEPAPSPKKKPAAGAPAKKRPW